MPLYEFSCRACGHEFEALVGPTHPAAACPKCQSEDLAKQVSAFGVSSAGIRESNIQSTRKAGLRNSLDKAVGDEQDERRRHEH